MAYRPSRKRKHVAQPPDVNITPVMNLIVVLIPLLLSVAQFVQLSLLDYQPPPAERLDDSARSEGDDRYLDLVVNVLESGFEVSMFGETEGEHFRTISNKSGGDHDFQTLQDELLRIRRDVIGAAADTVEEIDPATGVAYMRPVYRYIDADLVSIAARGDTPWELIVRVMDTSREYTDETGRIHTLFAHPRLGQIQ